MQLHQNLNLQPQRFREYLYMMEILSENRELKTYIKEAENMITQFNIENLPSYELGMEKGIEKGMEKGMEMGMEQGLEKIIRKLLTTQSSEQVARLTDLPIEMIQKIKNKTEH